MTSLYQCVNSLYLSVFTVNMFYCMYRKTCVSVISYFRMKIFCKLWKYSIVYFWGSVEMATFIIHSVSHLTQKVTLNTDEKNNVFFYLQDESCTQVIFQVGNWQASIYCKINDRDNWQENQFFKINKENLLLLVVYNSPILVLPWLRWFIK